MSKYCAKKLTDPLMREALIKAIRAVSFIDSACSEVGITRQTFYNTFNAGQARVEKNPGDKHWEAQFFYAVEKARLSARSRAIRRILRAGRDPRNWQANAWWLERTDPENFGRKAPAPPADQDKLTAAKAVKDALDHAEQTANAPIDEDY